MLNEPELLILDEPSIGLDPQGRHDILALIHELNVHDVTLFLATNNVRNIAEICDVVATMKSGRVAAPTTTKGFIAGVRGTTVQLEADLANMNERVLQAIKSVKGVKSIQCERLKISLDYQAGHQRGRELRNHAGRRPITLIARVTIARRGVRTNDGGRKG